MSHDAQREHQGVGPLLENLGGKMGSEAAMERGPWIRRIEEAEPSEEMKALLRLLVEIAARNILKEVKRGDPAATKHE